MAEKVIGKIVGPMPPKLFLDAYLAKPKVEMSDMTIMRYSANIQDLDVCEKKKLMSSMFVKSVQPLCRHLRFCDMDSSIMTGFNDIRIKPDVCAYTKVRGWNIWDITQPGLSIMFKMKPSKNYDPFTDPSDELRGKLLHNTKKAKETLSQITSYAAAHLSAQFRTHIFNVLVFPTYCRILRWDRSGMVVTRKINLSDSLLPEFLHRYEHAGPGDRGEDTSVNDILSKDVAYAAWDALDSICDDDDDDNDGETLQAFVSPNKGGYVFHRKTYMNTTKSPLGRSTRSFIAYSIDLQAVVFIKDVWRVASRTPEHEVYAKLHMHNVPYIATVVDAADISGQATRTQDLLKTEGTSSWAVDPPDRLHKYIHYRLVLREVASPLTVFPSTKFLVKTIQEAIVAHQKAFSEAQILHRDISVNNVMVYNNHALLLDWDMSKSIDKVQDQDPKKNERTGTWQFMAARLLSEDMNGPHNLTDELESFLHLMTWVAFMHAPHKMPLDDLRYFMKYTYNYSHRHANGEYYGGDRKRTHLIHGAKLQKAGFANPPFYQLLLELTRQFGARYVDNPTEVLFSEDDLEDESFKEHIIQIHGNRLENIKKSEWMITTISRYLEMEGWPANDAAVERDLIEKPTFDSIMFFEVINSGSASLKRPSESYWNSEESCNKKIKLL